MSAHKLVYWVTNVNRRVCQFCVWIFWKSKFVSKENSIIAARKNEQNIERKEEKKNEKKRKKDTTIDISCQSVNACDNYYSISRLFSFSTAIRHDHCSTGETWWTSMFGFINHNYVALQLFKQNGLRPVRAAVLHLLQSRFASVNVDCGAYIKQLTYFNGIRLPILRWWRNTFLLPQDPAISQQCVCMHGFLNRADCINFIFIIFAMFMFIIHSVFGIHYQNVDYSRLKSVYSSAKKKSRLWKFVYISLWLKLNK